jgi:hypothetical protein
MGSLPSAEADPPPYFRRLRAAGRSGSASSSAVPPRVVVGQGGRVYHPGMTPGAFVR